MRKTSKRDKRRRRRSGSLVQILNGILALVILAMALVVAVALYGVSRFYAEGPLAEDTVFLVERGSGLGGTANSLADAGIIDNPWIFRFGGVALRQQDRIKAGEFRIAARSTMAEVLREITEGRPILHQVTIPEGFTSWQVVERLQAADDLAGDIEAVPAEGTLLPNTYSYQRGDDRQAVLDAMAAGFQSALAEVWEGRDPDLPISSPQELVTLASIVEKETGVPEERPRVAAVLVNRLVRGMRLQSDPTTIYGITGGQDVLGRGLRQSEIRGETPYNTYVISGLPPGPIANPGVESLRAAANPADTNDLYFVADGTGGHAFAETYAEHRRNVAEWRRIESERAEAAEAAALDARDELEAAEAASIGEQTGDDGDGAAGAAPGAGADGPQGQQ